MSSNKYFARPRNSSYVSHLQPTSSVGSTNAASLTSLSVSSSTPVKRITSPVKREKTREDLQQAELTSPTAWIRKMGNDVFQMSLVPCSPPRNLVTSSTYNESISSDDDSDDGRGSRLMHSGRMKTSVSSPTFSPQSVKNGKIFNDTVSEVSNCIRIIAPNVSKLSRYSVLEVKLNSINECVVVLCSVDVLKMRSGFFHDILCEREENLHLSKPRTNDTTPLREPISIPEVSPYEAAAYLESLLEGRALFKGEWNICWARLSVMWFIDDHQLEYASQIESHMGRLFNFIRDHHWRTNPNILAGYKVALFRKGNGPAPTVITGTIIEYPSNTIYSRVRVLFDNNKSNSTSLHDAMSPVGVKIDKIREPYMAPGTPRFKDLSPPPHDPTEVIGDVELPFWVQREGLSWADPDEMFLEDAKDVITVTDKRIFWEMVRIIIDFPELTKYISNPIIIRNAKELALTLKRPENRCLWTTDGPDYIPKETATELITSAYVHYSQKNN